MGRQSSNGAGDSDTRPPRHSTDLRGKAQAQADQHCQAEISRRETDDRYRSLFENMSEGLFLAEVIGEGSGKPVDYRYLDVNPAFECLTGLARDEVVGKTARDLQHAIEEAQEDAQEDTAKEAVIEICGRVALTRKPERIERFPLPLGRTCATTAFSPARGQFAGLFRVVTRHSRAEPRVQPYQAELAEPAESTRLREVEAELEASEERFRTIAETLPQLVYEVAADDSHSYFNRRWSEYTGREPRGVSEQSELVHADDRPRFLAAWTEAVRQTHPFECRYRLRRHDGQYRWFHCRAFPIRSSAGTSLRWFGTATDVHDLTATQGALREEEALLRAVIDTIAEPVYVKDAESRLILVNAATVTLLGKPKHELIGHTERDFYQDRAVADAILEHDRQVMTSGTVQSFEETVVTADGLRILLNTKAPRRDAADHIIGLVSVARDITELKRAEEERAKIVRETDEQRGRLQAIVDSLPVGLWITDETGKILVINDRARAIWGGEAPAAETIQEYALYRLWKRDGDQPMAPQDMPLARALHGDVTRDLVLDFQRFDGTCGTQLVAASPVKTPDGRISGAVVVAQDITERRRMEAALLDADRRKNEFLAVLSHELRNPLAPIANSLYILDHAPPDGEQASRAKQVLGRQVAQLSNLVNDLLDVTRIARNKIRLQKERLELNELVARAVEDNRSLFDAADIHLELSLTAARIPIVADRSRIAQVVGNLLHNAAKFTFKGGDTRVSVAVEGFTAVLCVADDGVGIAAETLAGLFQPFAQADQTLDRSKGGLGLGLALVKALVEMHGGTVSAHSDGLGRGAKFEVRLPMDARATADTAAVPGRSTGLRRRILIIEDNVDAADSLREALELSEHEVIIAHDGLDGLAKARQNRPEVILCDIGLPGMDGFAVARAIRADQGMKGIFLVALSGYALPEDLQRSSEAGFQHHLAKPPSLEKLEQLLANLSPSATAN